MPYPPHEAAAESIRIMLHPITGFMRPMGTTSYVPAPGVVRQADAAYRPRHVPNPGPGNPSAANPQGTQWPTLLIEVAYSCSLASVIQKANQWLGIGTGVQVVLVVKLYSMTAHGVAMVALRFERGAIGPTYAISFGTRALHGTQRNQINGLGGAQLIGVGQGGAACNAAGVAIYQFRIPTNLVTVGMPAANVPAAANFTFDLFTLQQETLDEY